MAKRPAKGQGRIEFGNVWQASQTIFAIIHVLRSHMRQGHRPEVAYLMEMLSQNVAAATRLLDASKRLGVRTALGAGFPSESWKDLGPKEALEWLRQYVAVEEGLIDLKQDALPFSRTAEAKKLSAQIAKMRKSLNAGVARVRKWMLKVWPAQWTETEEREFARHLR